MFFHMLCYAMDILKKAHMAKLVYFVIAYGLHHKLFFNIFQVIGRSGNSSYSRSWKADFGGRTKFVHHIWVARPFTFRKNLNQVIVIDIIQMVYPVCIVPVNPKILCRRL